MGREGARQRRTRAHENPGIGGFYSACGTFATRMLRPRMAKRLPKVARVVVSVSLPMPMWVALDARRAEVDRPIADILREAARFYLASLAPAAPEAAGGE